LSRSHHLLAALAALALPACFGGDDAPPTVLTSDTTDDTASTGTGWADTADTDATRATADSRATADTGRTPTEPCESTQLQYPADGATAYPGTSVMVLLEEPDPTATLEVTGVAGTSSVEEGLVVFTPDAPMAPGSTAAATLVAACGVARWSFTVGEALGAPPSRPDEVWHIGDDRDAVIIAEEGVAGLYEELFLGRFPTLLVQSTSAATASAIDLRMASGSVEQDACVPTAEATASLTGGVFDADLDGASLYVLDIPTPTASLRVRGGFAADGGLVGVSLDAVIDTRDLLAGLHLPTTAPSDAACDILGAAGIRCGPCPHIAAERCIPLRIEGLQAEVVDVEVEAIDEPGAACD